MLPERLVLVQMKNNCMFCSNPTGESYIYTVSHFLGYITCEKCKEIGKQKADEFINTVAYGRVRHLKDTNIKIKRSNNTIEEGWKLYNPFVCLIDGVEHIECKHIDKHLAKWCNVDTILDLNIEIELL